MAGRDSARFKKDTLAEEKKVHCLAKALMNKTISLRNVTPSFSQICI